MADKQKIKVLVVDDEPNIVEILKYNLQKEGYSVHWEREGRSGLARCQSLLPDLCVLDLMLPGMDGLEVLDFGRDALWTTVWMCAPAMIAGLVVGLVIAFFQALTQIQEMTLVFVPKIIAIFAALLIFLPLMGGLLANFADQVFTRIAEF